MTTSIPQGSLLDVLKKKMTQTKEEMERYKDECEEMSKRLHLEAMRREEVSSFVDLGRERRFLERKNAARLILSLVMVMVMRW